MKITLIFGFSLLIGTLCDESKYRLTSRENEIRLGSCGESLGETLWLAPLYTEDGYVEKLREEKMNEQKKTTVLPEVERTTTNVETESTTTTEDATTGTTKLDSTEETVTVTEKTEETSTELMLTTTKPKPSSILISNAVFISQNHLILSSSWFIRYLDSAWKWKDNNRIVNDSICKEDRNASFLMKPSNGYVLDIHRQWRKVEEIIFLRFCEFHKNSEGFLALISVSRKGLTTVPVVCLPKSKQKERELNKRKIAEYGEESEKRVEQIEWSSDAEVVNSVRKCGTTGSSSYYTLGDSCKMSRGAPLVESDPLGIQRLIGVGVQDITGLKPHFHITQKYINEICKTVGICKLETGVIDQVPSEKDEEVKKIMDDDYVEIVEEPEISVYNGQEEKRMIFGTIGLILVFWIFK
ncbi:hypothetical protein CRE_29676 [Caenorhabditis remanei]|uniref:Peptidase S1 domain-containing protein n=1 Tax=Caenorhabditis remanei TaxID=31234 RepID=E3LV57_CAERE|nr:hypothetical protein CRE_29676 [Caenorhabditis remanei]